ncbi:hypothetical protein BDP27DRAFT_1328389, partial [Rhodocollybia butyracea]
MEHWPEDTHCWDSTDVDTITRAHYGLEISWHFKDTAETLPFRKDLVKKLIIVEDAALKLELGNCITRFFRRFSFRFKLSDLDQASCSYSSSMDAHGLPLYLVETPRDPCDSELHHLGPKLCGCGVQSRMIQLEDGKTREEHFVWIKGPSPPEPKVRCLHYPCRKECSVPGDWVLKE